MTPPDPTPPPGSPLDDGPVDDDTLAVNAVVDDEATADQRRRVARDPELVARVADLRTTVAALAAPADAPAPDVLAAIRRRALDALDEAPTEATAVGPTEAASPYEAPVRDLGAARARRTRSLPPLSAVAAVVVLLVLVGVGLLVAGTGGGAEDSADGGGDAAQSDTAGGSAGDDASAGQESPAAADGATNAEQGRPSDARVAELLERATARYPDQDALLEELRRIDPTVLGLSGEGGTGGDATTTTIPGPGGEAATTVPDTDDESTARTARALAADPDVVRCDDVVRSAEQDLGPATEAAFVDVDGDPVLILSTPVEVSDVAPAGIRFTVLNALDCSPRDAVVR